MVLIGIAMGTFASMCNVQSRANRTIAANQGVTDLSHTLDTFLGSSQCSKISPNGSLFSNAGASPVHVTFSGPPSCTTQHYFLSLDTMQFQSGTLAVTSLPDPTQYLMLQPYSIASISFTALGGNGNFGKGGCEFPFQMKVSFTSPSGPPPLPIVKTVTAYTDASYMVTGACASPVGGALHVAGFAAFDLSRFSNGAVAAPVPSSYVWAPYIISTFNAQSIYTIDPGVCRGHHIATGTVQITWSKPFSVSSYPVVATAAPCPLNTTNFFSPKPPPTGADAFAQVLTQSTTSATIKVTFGDGDGGSFAGSPCNACASSYVTVTAYDF
jgi:hypothetical protein